MSIAVEIPVLLVAGIVLVAGLLLGAVVLRRVLISRGLGSFDCSLRLETLRESGPWRHGIARYGDATLDWFGVFALSVSPTQSLSRYRLEIRERRDPGPAEVNSVLPGWVVVRCAYGQAIVELAMSEGAYNGLAAWLESAPPGHNVSVA